MKLKYYIHILSFIVAILYLIGFKNKSKAYKTFSLFLIINVSLNFISDKLHPWFKIYNHFFINIIFLFQFGFLSLFYSYSFDSKKWRNLVEILLILVVGYLSIKYLYKKISFVKLSKLLSYMSLERNIFLQPCIQSDVGTLLIKSICLTFIYMFDLSNIV